MHRVRILMSLVVVLVIAASGIARAAREDDVRVMLGGNVISVARVASLHCHDLDHPIIRCYRSDRRLLRATEEATRRARWEVGGLSTNSVAYVRVFDNAGFEGASMLLSSSYSNLGVIGWNDRISSYRVVNGGTGVFSEHHSGGGQTTSFCCDAAVAFVGSARNDTFSSVTGSA